MEKELKERFRWKVVSIMVFAAMATVCTPVKELDDSAQISAVRVETVIPPAVLLGEPQIEGDDVIIPLIFGKYLFPIEIQVNISAFQNIDKILGLNPNKSMVFESLHDINRVDLIAMSGVVHSYIFQLQEVPSREEADIEKFDITAWFPESFLFVHTPNYDIINGNIEIIGISEHFPFTIFPHITVSQGAHLPIHLLPEDYTFTSYNTQIPLRVMAESGRERTWQVRLKQAQIISPAQAPNADVRERLSIQTQAINVSVSGGDVTPEVKSVEVDTEHSTIRIFIKSDEWSAAWEASLSFPIHPYTQMLEYKEEEIFLIQGAGIQKRFYIIDILDGYATEWKIESVRWLNPEAEIESFEVLCYQSEYELITLGTPFVHHTQATVEIPVEKGFDFGFPLVIEAYQWTISTDAQVIEFLPDKLIFYNFDTQYSVTVEAQNGEVKEWTISLVDARTGSNDARVLSYVIQSYSGTSLTDNNLVLSTQATIDVQNNTIALHILDWAEKLPLTVSGHIDISPGALLFPFSFGAHHELVFHTLNDIYTFTIVSENGETEQLWRIVLQNDALPKSSEKEVVDFISGTPSTGFQFSEKYIEPLKRQITLMVSERPSSSSLILAPRITVSPNARLLGIVSGVQISLSFDSPKLFYVQAEDESMEEWRIVLIYAPQIPNSGFESWGAANNSNMNLLPANGTGWCTANNSTMSNSSRTTGYNSPYAVQMQTVLQTLNFVIFKVTTITAATAFVGRFTLKTGANDVYNPMSMTNMGIPFIGDRIPIAFSIDYKYIRGAQLVFTEPNWGSLIPSFKNPVNLSGTDAANIRVELYHNPTGVFDYARSRNDAIARGEILIENSVPEWTHLRVPIEITPGKEGLPPTHIVVVFTSSHEGDYFKGASGSTLTADNFNLIYYQPEAGAKRVE